MAQAINQPSLRDDLHPRADARHAGTDPHKTEIAVVKGLEDSAERRGLDLVGCGHSSGLYLRTRRGQQESDARQKRTVPFFFRPLIAPPALAAVVRRRAPRHLSPLLPIYEEATIWPEPQSFIGFQTAAGWEPYALWGHKTTKSSKPSLLLSSLA